MAFKIGGTTVINNSSQIDWSRVTGKPTIVTGVAATSNTSSGSGNMASTSEYLEMTGSNVRIRKHTTRSNCNCNCNCNCRD